MPAINALQELIIAIDLCFEKGLVAPTLALLYSGIDAMAWLGLPDDLEDVTGDDFIRWTDRYLLPNSGIPCTALDLYSSRCGIVHSMTAESRAIRRGAAKRIFFAWGNQRADDMQQILDGIGQSVSAVQVDAMVKAFQIAVGRFVEASEHDPELNRRVEARHDKIFTNVQAQAGAAPDSR